MVLVLCCFFDPLDAGFGQVSAPKLLSKNEHLLSMLTNAAQHCHENSILVVLRGPVCSRSGRPIVVSAEPKLQPFRVILRESLGSV